MPETRINTGFRHFSPLLKLYRPRWLAGQIIEYSIDPLHLVDDPAHHLLQNLKWDLRRLSGHEIDRVHGTQCHGIIVGTLIAHNAHRAHVCECSEILVRHPCRCFAVLLLVLFRSLVHFLAVNRIGILNDLDFLAGYLADDTNAKSRTRKWLAENELLRNTHFETSLTNLVLEEVAKRLNNLFEIYIVRQSSNIVVGFDDC